MISQPQQFIQFSSKPENFQTNSILSTSSDHLPCQAQSLQIYPIFPEFPKKNKNLPKCYSCEADDCTMLFDKKDDCEEHKKVH